MKTEDLFQTKHRVSRKHTVSNTPKYDPDRHLKRRNKDEEELKGLLTDLIRSEISKYFEK
tara:strand:+ start:2005 stop:2184 length:180 start_codon:yes stop_codon:yes gene_type:complete